jgi:Toxin SymE, type I toxin-antitoxin system
MIRKTTRRRTPEQDFVVPVYRRRSRRGANGGRRELSVTPLSRVRGAYRRREQIVPYIRMSGVWLQRLGFRPGARIEITAERERLVLTIVPHDRELPIN